MQIPLPQQQQLRTLIELDRQKNALGHQAKSLPEHQQLKDAQEALDTATKQQETARQHLADAQAAATALDDKSSALSAKIAAEHEHMLQPGSTSRELTAMQQDITHLEQQLEEVEAEELEALELVDARTTELAEADAQVKQAEAAREAVQQRGSAAMAALREQRDALATEREGVAANIGDALLRTYADPGIGVIEARKCSHCMMELTPVQITSMSANSAETLDACQDCGTLLIVTERSGI